MTTITPFAAGSYATNRTITQLTSLKSQLNDLSGQLTSGLTAQSYGGLGTGRTTALSAQASISALTGYGAVIDTAQTRAKLGTTSLSEVVTVATDTNTTLQNGLQSTSSNMQAAKSTALNNLNAALDALNQSDGSVYLFGGTKGSVAPVVDANTILNGTTDSSGNKLDGLTTLVSDQVTADLGPAPASNGWLTQTNGTTTVSLTEGPYARRTGAAGAFGYSLSNITASNPTSLAVTSSGSPVTYTVGVNAQPNAGDTLTVTLGLPDGTSTAFTLTASAGSADPTATSSFAIGSTPAQTATNLQTTLKNALANSAGSTLTANAAARVSKDFFAASTDAGTTPRRVYTDPATGGPTYTYPTTTPATTVKQSVVWYKGESGPDTTARASQTYQVGSSATIQLGARANETPIQNVLAGLATVALGIPSGSTANASDAYQAVVNEATPLLASAKSGHSVQDITTDFSLASARMSSAATANTAQQNTLQNTVDGIEQASTEEVATRLMDLQTRLQASYQITASLSKLSLVNYIT
ncbi:flagellin [Methylobacterium persicinum]|uniref:Flagellin-like hook-associated protein FlgL n=1 Tax=Methylobacterium persicinum TaxID=374426 RepID=A0ABU0HIQ3_9HYPH|nr:flagellin [Methylobacterium persicinum]MDQ0441703.1 flagellin-like hook-associated protein FlgL [Methylobacterium persicinum]GJE39874.1 hypothetical protein KHHGKMAE_3962 [Methylobacterium persicinum]